MKLWMPVLGLFALSLLMSAYFYGSLPDQVAVHWNASGSPNGYMPKTWGAFTMPLIIAALGLLFLAIPAIDPLRANIAKFMKHYVGFVSVLLAFLLLMQLHGLLWNTGTRINPAAPVAAGVGLLLFFTGDLCESSKRNWFIGIRTPWTLSSDRVWERTNGLGGKLFKACGAVSLLGVAFPDLAVILIMAPLIAVAVFTVAFSYLEYRKEEGAKKPKGR